MLILKGGVSVHLKKRMNEGFFFEEKKSLLI